MTVRLAITLIRRYRGEFRVVRCDWDNSLWVVEVNTSPYVKEFKYIHDIGYGKTRIEAVIQAGKWVEAVYS